MSSHRAMYSAHAEAPTDWPAAQDELVREAVRYAADHSPEVRMRLEGTGVDPAGVSGVSDLGRIPVLSKDSRRQSSRA